MKNLILSTLLIPGLLVSVPALADKTAKEKEHYIIIVIDLAEIPLDEAYKRCAEDDTLGDCQRYIDAKKKCKTDSCTLNQIRGRKPQKITIQSSP